MAPLLATRVAFFSIGSDDLTQYVLAASTNGQLGALQDALHRAVLRATAATVEGADRAGIPVARCGELASDPAGALVLVGLGIDELSMDPGSLDAADPAGFAVQRPGAWPRRSRRRQGDVMTGDERPRQPGRVAGALLARAAQLDRAMRDQGPAETYLFWEFDPPLLSDVGYRLIEFDREARRETGRGSDQAEDRPRPLRIGEAGFRVVDASPGSLDLLVQAIGATEQVLRSDPVQFVIQVIGAIQAVRAVRSWIGRRGKVEGTITAADCRKILADAGEQSVEWDDHGPKVTGSARVTIVRQYADGSYDLVTVEPGTAPPAGS